MSYTYYDAVKAILRKLTFVQEGTTTAEGTTTTLIDGNLQHEDGLFEGGIDTGGVLLIDAHTSTVAVAASVQRVTNDAGTTLTFTPAHTNVVPAGVAYAVAMPDFPLWEINSAIAQALQELGKIRAVKTITTTDNREYTTSDDAVIAYEIKEIEIGSSDDGWQQHYNWRQEVVEDADTNEAVRQLIFDNGYIPCSGLSMRVTYVLEHPTVDSAAEIIYTGIDREALEWTAAVKALEARLNVAPVDNPQLQLKLQNAIPKAQIARARIQPPPSRVRPSRY